MPSINLLPENFTIEAYKKREKTAVYVLAVFFLIISSATYAWVIYDKKQSEEELKALDKETESIKGQIEKSVKENELLSSDYNKNDIEKILKDHRYYSKAIALLKDNTLNEVSLTELVFSENDSDTIKADLGLIAQSPNSLLKQLAVYQNSFWIKSYSFSESKTEKESAGISDKVTLIFRKDLFLFHDQYWDSGINLLAKNCNKYLSISKYSATLKKDIDKKTGRENQTVVVNFDGDAYSAAKLDEFQKNLENTDNVQEVRINRTDSGNDRPGVVAFRGTVNLKY